MKKLTVAIKRIETLYLDTDIENVVDLQNNNEIINKIKIVRNINAPEELLEIIEVK